MKWWLIVGGLVWAVMLFWAWILLRVNRLAEVVPIDRHLRAVGDEGHRAP